MLSYASEGKHCFQWGSLTSSLQEDLEVPCFGVAFMDFSLALFDDDLVEPPLAWDEECNEVEAVCGDFEEERDAMFRREPLERVRTLGASLTGSATRSLAPGRMLLEDRRFHRRRSSAEMPKRSATVISVSPRCTL